MKKEKSVLDRLTSDSLRTRYFLNPHNWFCVAKGADLAMETCWKRSLLKGIPGVWKFERGDPLESVVYQDDDGNSLTSSQIVHILHLYTPADKSKSSCVRQ